MNSRTGVRWLVGGFVVAVVFVLSLILFGELGEQFILGWLMFPIAVLPRVTVDQPSVIAGTVAFMTFAFGVHCTGRWCTSWLPENLLASRKWTLRQSGLVVMTVTLLFSLGTALVGAVHQVIWLSTNRNAPSLDVSIDPPPRGFIEIARQNAQRSSLKGGMKLIGIAMHNFHSFDSHFPPGGTMNSDGELLHGWMMPLGPYMGFYSEEIDYSVAWNKPPNDRVYRCQMDYFLNPMQPGPVFDCDGFGLTHYAANVHLFSIRPADPKHKGRHQQTRGLSMSEISDGVSNTLLFGTVGRNHKPWGHPANVRDPGEGLNQTPTGFGGPPGQRSAHFVMADGSVREISDKADPRVLNALATPNGNEPPLVHEKGSLWIEGAR